MQANEILFAGYIANPPKINQAQSGLLIGNFSICHSFKKKDGTSEATWMDVVCFNEWQIEKIKPLKKGDNVLVHGSIRVKSYTDKEGIKRLQTVIIANSIMIEPKPEDHTHKQANQSNVRQPEPMPFYSHDSNPFSNNEDIPF